MSYAKIIKTARLNRKLSQEELARLVGVTKGAVSQWESGESAPARRNQKALANALGINPAELEAVLSSGLSLLDTLPEGREVPFLAWNQLRQLNADNKKNRPKVTLDGLSGGVVVVDGSTPADAVAASVDDGVQPGSQPRRCHHLFTIRHTSGRRYGGGRGRRGPPCFGAITARVEQKRRARVRPHQRQPGL